MVLVATQPSNSYDLLYGHVIITYCSDLDTTNLTNDNTLNLD